MNYNDRLNCLIKRYFPYENINSNLDIINEIGKIIEENKSNNFAIWGSGEHTENLHKYFSSEIKDAQCIIDNNKALAGSKFLGFNTIKPDDIHEYNLDTIFISSYGGREDIKRQAEQLVQNCNIIDFYEKLEEKGIEINGVFYIYESTYIELYDFVYKYKNSCNRLEKQLYLKKIIVLYLKIRDIYNAKKFIKTYIEERFEDKNIFETLLLEIESLVIDLSNKLRSRKGNDILLLFLDSLRAKDVFDNNSVMKYTNKILDNSKYFTNAFASSIFTYESVPSMFIGKLPFCDGIYKRKLAGENEVLFIKRAIDEGYTIKIFTADFWKIIDGNNIQYGQYSNFMTTNFWNAICDLAQNENEKTIYLLYFLQEIHPPHICGYSTIKPIVHNTPFACNDDIKQTQEQYNIQYRDCLKYVDTQLEFYFNILGDYITKVLFSDHGQIIENAMSELNNIGTLAGWHDERYHVPLILNGDKVKHSKYDDMFSMIHLNDVIVSLMDNKEYINNEKYVEVNFSKICNDTIRKNYLKAGYEDYIHGFRVLRDDKYKLVITGNGKYKAYILPEQLKECKDENIKKMIIDNFKKSTDVSVPKI
ncbi:hypothetical protein DP145_00730 [Clostridium tetani]|uniref:sulfatase-like hydrolase/transferase n=1 Tax=Clostridium tetani TaxID=1513 RepID=UPI00100AA394|nr:sulfatase-like hydrolase/transferase [Clostridium tetani]RXI45896.1 hypothetical protein DP126_06810 [Clostridium tetani]RXM61288.1 hypothetical protein DP138_03645 [Clostridium tetani]RXM70113.1 hypothetical protein DP145_00730 [Clostridium tetani]